MRLERVHALYLGLALAAGVPTSAPALTNQVFGFTNKLWKYYQAGDLPAPQGGATWLATNYNDSTWASGYGALGFPNNENLLNLATVQTALEQFVPGSSAQVTSYYFRTTFNWTGPTTNATLTFSNLVDDGAVLYLNGSEIGRLAMPAGAPLPTTFASRADDISGHGVEVLRVYPATNRLRPGVNTLAVEVHQGSGTSSDAIWTCSLTIGTPEPIQIVRNLVGTNITEGDMLNLEVQVTGTTPWFKWYKDGFLVPGAPTNSGTFRTTATLARAGTWWVVITNSFGAVTSAVVKVNVRPDIYPPAVLSARIDSPLTNLVLTLSESLRTIHATNPANYVVQLLGTTNTVPVLRATHNLGVVTLFLSTSNLYFGSNYLVTVLPPNSDNKAYIVTNIVGGVTNRYTNYNTMSPSSNQVRVTFMQQVFPYEGNSLVWDWIFCGTPPTNWMSPDYNDGGGTDWCWPSLRGVIYYDNNPQSQPCAALGDNISEDYNQVTRWFRTHFNLPTNTGRGDIGLGYLIDDGAVFYLNGQEILRYNLPDGPISPATRANSDLDPNCLNSTNITVRNLRSGDNVLAVEVHQSTSTTSADIYYGVQIRAAFTEPPPRMTMIRTNRFAPTNINVTVTNFIITWPAREFPASALFMSTNYGRSNSWVQVATNSPFVTNALPRATRLFKMDRRN